MSVEELAPGLRVWTAAHPAWPRGARWDQEVWCAYTETVDATVLVGHGPPSPGVELAAALDRPPYSGD